MTRQPDLHERIRLELAAQLAELFTASGVEDAEPLSTNVDFDRRSVSVMSRTRGRVEIGRLDDMRFLAISSGYAYELEAVVAARTMAATAKRRLSADLHAERAAELKRDGLSAARIGVRMAHDEGREDRPYSERQVRKWLSAAGKKKG